MITIEWWNSTDIGNTIYSRGFRQQLILDTVLGVPEILEVIVGDSDGEGGVIPSFQRRSKQYKFEVFVPEYIVDALNDIRLHDNINITDSLGIVYPVANRNTFEVGGGTWSSTGCNKLLTIAFQTGERVIRTNCPPISCEDDMTICESVCIIADLDRWDASSYWTSLFYNASTIDLGGGTILITDFAGLESFLNGLGLGTWTVTGTATSCTITNIQDSPAVNDFNSIELEDPVAGQRPVYGFTSNC